MTNATDSIAPPPHEGILLDNHKLSTDNTDEFRNVSFLCFFTDLCQLTSEV